jgi:hypothetical protein
MYESNEDLLADFIIGTAEDLDVPPQLEKLAHDYYHAVGNWLVEYGEHYAGAPWTVQLQGSFNIGTVVRPIHKLDEYDVDLVCKRDIKKTSTSQHGLKQTTGDALGAFVKDVKGEDGFPKLDDEGRRCWTLLYPGFHIDAMPAIPDEEVTVGDTGLEITDRTQTLWLKTNPTAYAAWFKERMALEFVATRKALASTRGVGVDDIPEWEVRTPLQRIVQSLKRHRDVYFEKELDMRPPSILVTTLAALAYQPNVQFYNAIYDTVKRMPDFIDRSAHSITVMNPVCDDEDFGERISEDERRLELFGQWVDRLTLTIDELPEIRGGIPKLKDRLAEDFGEQVTSAVVNKIASGYRLSRETGSLKMSPGTGALTKTTGHKVSPHEFRGGSE